MADCQVKNNTTLCSDSARHPRQPFLTHCSVGVHPPYCQLWWQHRCWRWRHRLLPPQIGGLLYIYGSTSLIMPSKSLFIVCPLSKWSSLFHCLSIIGLFIYPLFTVLYLFVVRHACIVVLPRVDCCVGKKYFALATIMTRPKGSCSQQRFHESQKITLLTMMWRGSKISRPRNKMLQGLAQSYSKHTGQRKTLTRWQPLHHRSPP